MQNIITKTRYSDNVLKDFRTLIAYKISIAREELNEFTGALSASNSNGMIPLLQARRLKMALQPTKKSKPAS